MKKENIPKYLKAKGFYLSILTGLCAVFAIVLVYVSVTSNKKGNNVVDLNDPPMEQVADNDLLPPVVEVETPSPEPDEVASVMNPVVGETNQYAEIVDPSTVKVDPQKKVDTLKFNPDDGLVWPVMGNVIMNYSMETGIYYATLNQYKCNPALIIEGKVDDDVLSAAKGKVTKIEENEETGVTVTVDLGNKYTAIYGQLKDLTVKEGDRIGAGDYLGKLAEPTDYYLVEGPNLYFQLNYKEEPIDPMGILK